MISEERVFRDLPSPKKFLGTISNEITAIADLGTDDYPASKELCQPFAKYIYISRVSTSCIDILARYTRWSGSLIANGRELVSYSPLRLSLLARRRKVLNTTWWQSNWVTHVPSLQSYDQPPPSGVSPDHILFLARSWLFASPLGDESVSPDLHSPPLRRE